MRKRIDGNDPNRATYIIADDARRLTLLNKTECDIAIMIDHFIENDTSAFYPQYAEMKKRIE